MLTMELLLTSLPDDLVDWRGTAAELAEKANLLLPRLNLQEDAGSLNERLVRYYVSEKVLTPPEREGREAMFGFRQVIELLVTRYLLRDGWPLAKIADMVQSSDLVSLQNLVPSDRPRATAEELVARFRRGEPEVPPSPDFSLSMPVASRSAPTQRGLPLTPRVVAERSSAPPALEMAAELTRRKAALTDNLKALGNADGRPQRRKTIRIELTPWCQVHINAEELLEISDEATETLGTALTQALQEERSRRGERP
jgi:DNA-binding transcriptional MerR regulator